MSAANKPKSVQKLNAKEAEAFFDALHGIKPKTKKPERKGRVVAKVHVIYGPDGAGRECIVLPADAASVERIMDQMADAFSGSYDGHLSRSDLVAMLAAIGIAATGKGARK